MMGILLPTLAFLTVVTFGGAILAAHLARRQPVQKRLRDLENADRIPGREDESWRRRLRDVAAKVPAGRPSPKLQQQLIEAGYHGKDAASVYLVSKIALFLGGLVPALVFVVPVDIDLLTKAVWIALPPSALFFLPNLVVGVRRSKRCGEVRMHLPDAIDLLEICVSSGMGLDMAWNAVADEVRRVCSILADEMALTNLEIHLGGTRAIAMRHMADRTDSQELRSLVAILVQSERFGTSIAEALRTFAKSMRENRSQRAEEAAEKMAVKLLFPMVVFIFPVVILVAAGPAGIILARTLGTG